MGVLNSLSIIKIRESKMIAEPTNNRIFKKKMGEERRVSTVL